MRTTDLIQLASNFAKNAHDSIAHRRKYSDEPYHVHLERVAGIVATVTSDPTMIAAAWLHDVLEDVAPKNSEYGSTAILTLFGERVLQLVLEVSDVSKSSDGNRATRKAIDRAHYAKASPDGKTIKLADMIDNYIDISQNDTHFARVFRKEALLLLPHLQAGSSLLYQKLCILLQEQRLR